MSKPKYIVIPEIAGRLIVGEAPGGWRQRLVDTLAVTNWVDVMSEGIAAAMAEDKVADLEERVATLKAYMKASTEAGTVFYFYDGQRAWETAAMCLMARYGWTPTRTQIVLSALSDSELDLTAAEAALKTYLERGSN
jgi:hypothetical protein